MSRNIFGWSYPPGCSGPPEDDTTCPACGLDSELAEDKGGCSCSPCAVCGEPGCITHMESRAIRREIERLEIVLFNLREEEKKRYEAKPTICKLCGQPIGFSEAFSQDGIPFHLKCEEEDSDGAEAWWNEK